VKTRQALRDKYKLPPPPPGWPRQLGAAFQGRVGDIVRTISPHTESDLAALLLQFLVGYGSVAGPGSHFHVGETRHATNLYTVAVGETARTRKGTSLDFVSSPLRIVDRDWADKCMQGGLSTGEGLVALAAGSDDPNSPPKEKRFLFVEDEFSSVLRVMKRRDSTLSAILRRAWDGRTLRVTTRHQPLYVSGAHVSLIGHITLHDLRRHMSTSDVYGGLFNRILWICVRRSQLLPGGGRLPQRDVDRLVESVRPAVEFGSKNRATDLSTKARALWDEEYYELTNPPRSSPLVDAVTARGEAQVRRLAMIYALMDLSRVVKLQHLRCRTRRVAILQRFCAIYFWAGGETVPRGSHPGTSS
jgi:Protein of unknown function (DUF3987)